MLSYGNRLRFAAAVAACTFVVPVYADAPAMTIMVSAGSLAKSNTVQPGTTSAGGVGTYIGSLSGTNGSSSIWNCNYNFSAASSALSATESGSVSLTNSSSASLAFALTISIPTQASGPMSGLFNGSVSAALITAAGTGGVGSMGQVGFSPLWVATTGTTQVNALFSNWATATRSTPGVTFIGSQSFGGSQPSFPVADFGSPLAITFNFILSAGATASFSTAFAGVGTPAPAPGAIAVLAMAGLGARRRRR